MKNFWNHMEQRLIDYDLARERGIKAYDTRLRNAAANRNDGAEPKVSPLSGRMHAPYDGYVWVWMEGNTECEATYLAGQYLPYPKERESLFSGDFTGDHSVRVPLERADKFIRIWKSLIDPLHLGVDVWRSRHWDTDKGPFCFFRISRCPQDVINDVVDYLIGDILRDNEAERQALEDERAARDSAHENGQDAPTGRVVITGQCLHFKMQESMYGNVEKMLVQDDRGFRVWGTVPRSLDDAERGSRVRFIAQITVSDDNPKFGFFKRPTKGEVLTSEEAA